MGIRAEVGGRALLTHERGGFRLPGISGSLASDPAPGSDRGPRLSPSQTVRVSAAGGADGLLGRRTLEGLGATDDSAELDSRRLELTLGYGFSAFGGGFTSTPELSFGLIKADRELGLGWRLVRDRRGDDIGSLELLFEGRRRESANDPGSGSGAGTATEHSMGFRATARF